MSGVLHGVLASLKAAAAAVTDAFFEYVSLLLNTTSTNGAQNNTFLDGSTNAFSITRNGNTTQGNFSPFSQTGWSNYFDGTGDYLETANNAALNILSGGDFTVECWFYANALAENAGYGSTLASKETGGTGGWSFRVRPSGIDWVYSGLGGAAQAFTFTVGTWYYVVAQRTGTTFNFYINGTKYSPTYTNRTTDSANPFRIALNNDGGNLAYLNGYISNLRIVKGTAVYTSNFTPPTAPLTAITNTSLLTCQSNRFIDNSSNAFAITRNGDVSVQAFSPFNPTAAWSAATYGGSGYFDGTGDYLSVPRNNAFLPVANEDFTIEAWVYLTATPGATASSIAGLGEWGTDSDWTFYIDSSLQATFYINAIVTGFTNTTSTLRLNAWNHVAASRSGTGSNNLKVFVNGVGQSFTTNSTTVGTGNRALTVGSDQNGDESNLTGYVTDFRIVKGTAVYTANFTPPTAPLTAITNTSLLLNFTNAGIYDSASGNDLETVGNAQVSTTQAKWGTTSMAFDGTGDWLFQIDRPTLRLGTADFTIEGWVYLSATGVAYGLISKGTATTGWSVNVTSGNKLQFSYTATQLTGATSLAATTWYYFAVVRSGSATGNLKLYLNGSVDATSAGAVTDNFNQTNVMYIGADRVGGSALNGYLDDVRITNGYARTISTPTAAFPVQ